jgi:phage-related protein
VRNGASVLKVLLETAGDLMGGVLHIISNLTESISAVKTSLSGILPLVFDVLGMVSGRVSQTVGPAIEWIGDTKGIISDGIVQAAKSSGNLFSGLVEGTQGFKAGLLEGIKLGVNDETSPPPENNPWR